MINLPIFSIFVALVLNLTTIAGALLNLRPVDIGTGLRQREYDIVVDVGVRVNVRAHLYVEVHRFRKQLF